MYIGTGEPRTLDVAKSTVCACCRARRVTSDVGSAAATAAADGVGLLLNQGESLGDRHFGGRDEHAGEREGVGARRLRARADRHRRPEDVDGLAELAVVARGRL